MPLASLSEVRDLGKLPDSTKLADSLLQPHLTEAAYRLKDWIGAYEDSDDSTKIAKCKIAEGCITMSFYLLSANSFFTEGVTTLQKEVGEMDFQFKNAEQREKDSKAWVDRAKNVVRDYMNQNTETPILSFRAV